MTESEERKQQIDSFLREHGWIEGNSTVEFLAAGEYNENYLVTSAAQRTVFRINHGSQLNLNDQIAYEFAVLENVAPSGVTPRPLHVCASHPVFPRGAMLMTYIPGRHLDYRTDLREAAECFARVHAVDYDYTTGPLLVQADPILDIVAECRGLLGRYDDHPLPDSGRIIHAYLERVRRLSERASFAGESPCIVNTEVNSGNFLVSDRRVRLVDWEKAVASYRYQDLGHFLVPTTTLWKTDFRFDAPTRRRFLQDYHDAAEPPVGLDELDERTALLEKTILLRAFSWVYMAYAEYTSEARSLTNPDTFATIQRYLNEIDTFLEVG